MSHNYENPCKYVHKLHLIVLGSTSYMIWLWVGGNTPHRHKRVVKLIGQRLFAVVCVSIWPRSKKFKSPIPGLQKTVDRTQSRQMPPRSSDHHIGDHAKYLSFFWYIVKRQLVKRCICRWCQTVVVCGWVMRRSLFLKMIMNSCSMFRIANCWQGSKWAIKSLVLSLTQDPRLFICCNYTSILT